VDIKKYLGDAKMYKIYVNLNKKLNGENSKKMIVWAQFKLQIDANNYAEHLKKSNPTWDIIVK